MSFLMYRAAQVVHDAAAGTVVVSGGEDGRLCAWKQEQQCIE